ncbi:MAG: PKD domain-containing protein [Bacteroidota bacterium]
MSRLFLLIGYFFAFTFQLQAQPYGAAGSQTAVTRSQNPSFWGYYEYLPEDFDINSGDKYPVVLYLSGIGQKGDGEGDLSKIIRNGPAKLINNGQDYPAIVISPQSSSGWFGVNQCQQFYDYLVQNYPVDTTRFYVTGLSAGGGSTWQFAEAHPELIAGIVPICGANKVSNPATQLQNVPIWAFHNFNDFTIPRSFTEVNVDRITNISATVMSVYPFVNGNQPAAHHYTLGFDNGQWQATQGVVTPTSNLTYTVYKNGGHNAWSATYDNQDMWDWLFAQSKGSLPPSVDAGSDITISESATSLNLNGSVSVPSGRTVVNYNWSKISGPSVDLSGANTATLTLTNFVPGDYTFEFSIIDSEGFSASDNVNVTVQAYNEAPVSDAGSDVNATTASTNISIDGSGSFDPDGTIQSYLWNILSAPSQTSLVVCLNFAETGITAASPWNNTDGSTNAGQKISNAINTQGGATGINVAFQDSWGGSKLGGANTGNNSGALPDDVMETTYWFQNDQKEIRITGLEAGSVYDFTFFGSRNGGGDKTTVYAIGSASGSLNASNNSTEIVKLESITADANGEVLIEISNGGSAAYGYLNAIIIESDGVNLDNTDQAVATLSNFEAGTYTLELEVTDNNGLSDKDTVLVNVSVANNAAPVADAGADQTVSVGQTVTLDGLSSYDPDGTITSYQWSLTQTSAQEALKVSINFAQPGYTYGNHWNNTDGSINTGTKIYNAIDENGVNTGVSLTFLDNWGGKKTGGETTGNNSGVFPDEVMRTCYWFRDDQKEVRIAGLNPGYRYNFTFFGSRDGGGDKTTVYTIGSQSDSLDAADNTSEVAVLTDVLADANGEVLVIINNGQNAAYSYLNALTIESQGYNLENDDQAIATLTNLDEGSYTFALQVTDNLGGTATDSVTVNVTTTTQAATSSYPINTNSLAEGFNSLDQIQVNAFPNPSADGLFYLESEEETYNIRVMDLNGRTVEQFELQGRRLVDLTLESEKIFVVHMTSSSGEYRTIKLLKK